MNNTLKDIFSPNKGILAADESVATMNKRLATVNLKESEEVRREYREMLFSTPNIERFTSGVILFEETYFQKPFVQTLQEKNIQIGIKVDEGLADFEDGKITKGLETLNERLQKFELASFTKWRNVFSVTDSNIVLEENTDNLLDYAQIVLSNGKTPILEPEILSVGSHTEDEMLSFANKLFSLLFKKLACVDISNCVIKTGFAIPGNDSKQRVTPLQVGEGTLALLETFPKELGGVVFLSGGLSPTSSTEYLRKTVKIGKNLPFPLTFSFGRALQTETLNVWSQGEKEKAQGELIQALQRNSKAL